MQGEDHPVVSLNKASLSGDKAYRYLLTVLGEETLQVRRHYLSVGEYIIGAIETSDLVLPLAGVSRRHVRLAVLEDGGVILEDLGSKNGTFVGGRRITRLAIIGDAMIGVGPVRLDLKEIHEDLAYQSSRSPSLATQSETPPGEIGIGERSTDDPSEVERLVDALAPLINALCVRERSVAEAALEIARRWAVVTDAKRVEISLTIPDGDEVVVAQASRDSAGQDQPPDVDAVGPYGWRLRVWNARSGSRKETRVFAEMLTHVLARPNVADKAQRLDGDLPPDQISPPPPGSLNPEIRATYRRVAKVADGEIPVVILGESGVGKEVLARWLHERSPRAHAPFLAVNCAALPRDLLEAELFGIESRVATGVDARAGIFEQANGGTVLLDEIGDMALETQAKILRALENKTVRRVGGRVPVHVDVRYVAATNHALEHLVSDGRFRADLFHRLAGFVVSIPPLRSRREDIPLLASYFFERECLRANKQSPGLTRSALGALVQHTWPGNVRQLENEMAKAVLLLEPNEPLDLSHLSASLQPPVSAHKESLPLTLKEALAEAERNAFQIALASSGGDHGRAIKLLQISRATFYRKLKDLMPQGGWGS